MKCKGTCHCSYHGLSLNERTRRATKLHEPSTARVPAKASSAPNATIKEVGGFISLSVIKEALRSGSYGLNLGYLGEVMVANRLRQYGERMQGCIGTDEKPVKKCTQALMFGGKVLADEADLIARSGLLGFLEHAGTVQGTLIVDTVLTMPSLRPYLRGIP